MASVNPPQKKYDVVAVSALAFDVHMTVDESVLEEAGLPKGLGIPVSAERHAHLMNSGVVRSKTTGSPGGNVASSIVFRGGKAAVIGKIANDDHGTFVAENIAKRGVVYTPVVSDEEDAVTTCVLVLATPDKERTFAFVDGAACRLMPEDIDVSLVGEAKVTYLDSYLWASETGRAAVCHAAAEADRAGGLVAMALNDADLVAQHREAYLALAREHGAILLGDRREFESLLGTENFDEIIETLHKMGCTAALTVGKGGAYVIGDNKAVHIPANKVNNVVDTNGAGDAFAAGFIQGLVQGKSLEAAGRQGTLWASEIIQHVGGVPKTPEVTASTAHQLKR